MSVLLKYAKKQDHVSLRAKQRTKVSPEEIALLREELKKLNLRRGETYHKTWPGRGHAIIGDVGKKRAHHVVKTMYKPSDTPPGRRMEKRANFLKEVLIKYLTKGGRKALESAEARRILIEGHARAGVPYSGQLPAILKGISSKAKMKDAIDLTGRMSRATPERNPGALGRALALGKEVMTPKGPISGGLTFAPVPGATLPVPFIGALRESTSTARMARAMRRHAVVNTAHNVRKARGLPPLKEDAHGYLIKASAAFRAARLRKEASIKAEIDFARSRADHRYVKILTV